MLKQVVTTGLVVLGIGQVWAQAPNDFGAQRVERPPLMGVGKVVVDEPLQRVERPPRMGVGTVEALSAPINVQPDTDDLSQQGKPVKWKFRINAHAFGAATIWECPGDYVPPNQNCSGARSPTEVNRCGDGGTQFWAYPFPSAVYVPCGGPFPTVTLTYWRQDYAQLEPPRIYQALVTSQPSGPCNSYGTTATLNPSYCPSPTPQPSPSPSPTPTATVNPSPSPTATATATATPTLPPSPTPTDCGIGNHYCIQWWCYGTRCGCYWTASCCPDGWDCAIVFDWGTGCQLSGCCQTVNGQTYCYVGAGPLRRVEPWEIRY